MEEKEAIERLKKLIKLRKNKAGEIKFDTCICCTADLETVLNLLEKKDKMIDSMADYIDKTIYRDNEYGCEMEFEKDVYCDKDDCKKCIKQYFEKKVSETNE